MEGYQTARLERLKEVRKRSTAIAKERVKKYQKQRNLARANDMKLFMELNEEFMRWEAQKRREEAAAALVHVGEAHRNAVVATVMDEERQKGEKLKKDDIEAARKARWIAATNKLDKEVEKNTKRIKESRKRRAAVASRAAAERYAAAEFGASIKETAEAKEAYEKEAARRLALWIEQYAQVSQQPSYVPQAATVLPDVRDSVMVPVDVVKHGSQPGKHLAAIQGSGTLSSTIPMGTEGGITVVNVKDEAEAERNKVRQIEKVKVLTLKGFAESAQFRGYKALSKERDIRVAQNVDEKFQIHEHSLKWRGCGDNVDNEMGQNCLATMKVKERLKRRSSLTMSGKQQQQPIMVVESDEHHHVSLALPKVEKGKLNKNTTIDDLQNNNEVNSEAPYFCTLRSKAFAKVEAEVSPTSSDHLQSVVINKNRDNRHEQEQYPSLPHQQQQQQPLVLVSKKPNRGTIPVMLDLCPTYQVETADYHPMGEPKSPYPEAPLSTQRTMTNRRGDDLRASNMLQDQQQHPSVMGKVDVRMHVRHQQQQQQQLLHGLSVNEKPLGTYIRSHTVVPQKVPYNHEADVVVLSEEGSESQKAHLVDGGVNYTSSSPFDDVRNDNPVVGPTTSVAISKFIEEGCELLSPVLTPMKSSSSSSTGSSNEKEEEENDMTVNQTDDSESLADALHSVISAVDYRSGDGVVAPHADDHHHGKFEYLKNKTDANSWNSDGEPQRSSLSPSSEDGLETRMTDTTASSCKSSSSQFLISAGSSKFEELLSVATYGSSTYSNFYSGLDTVAVPGRRMSSNVEKDNDLVSTSKHGGSTALGGTAYEKWQRTLTHHDQLSNMKKPIIEKEYAAVQTSVTMNTTTLKHNDDVNASENDTDLKEEATTLPEGVLHSSYSSPSLSSRTTTSSVNIEEQLSSVSLEHNELVMQTRLINNTLLESSNNHLGLLDGSSTNSKTVQVLDDDRVRVRDYDNYTTSLSSSRLVSLLREMENKKKEVEDEEDSSSTFSVENNNNEESSLLSSSQSENLGIVNIDGELLQLVGSLTTTSSCDNGDEDSDTNWDKELQDVT